MFDLEVFANPVRMKRAYLATTEVATQAIPAELQCEFDQLREENPEVFMTGHFWWDYVFTYKRHLSWLVFGRCVMTVMLLVSVLASARILDESNTLTAAIWLVVFYALVQVAMKIVNAWTSLLQHQLIVCKRTFVPIVW